MAEKGLTPRQRRFVEEYLIDLNATQAAIRAGYSERNANKVGPKLVGKGWFQNEFKQAQERESKKAEVNAAKVIKELSTLAFSDIGQVIDFSGEEPRLKPASEIPEAARRAISSMKVKRYMEGHGEDARTVEVTEFKLWSKSDALDKLARHLGLFVERHSHEHSGKVEADVTVRIQTAVIEAGKKLEELKRTPALLNGTNGNGKH